MKIYNVKTRVTHDGESFEPGDEIELANEHADPLLAVGAIEDKEAAEKAERARPKREPKRIERKGK